MNTGKILQERRRALGLSRNEVASWAGVSISYLKKIETGHARPGIKTILRLAVVLELSLSELLKE